MKQLIFIPYLLLFLNCGGGPPMCQFRGEIPSIYLVKDNVDSQKICECYTSNREYFIEQKRSSQPNNSENIRKLLLTNGISENSIDIFLKNWTEEAKVFRETTIKRNQDYKEGIDCLDEITKNELPKFESYIADVKNRLEKHISKEDLLTIKQDITTYSDYIATKKEYFLENETLFYGELGQNIITYNQKSFDIIDRLITSEYDFGFKDNFRKKMLKIYSHNKYLQEEFETYKQRESELVSKIQQPNCFKRIGILRFYDDLNEEQKNKAIKVNMLLNVFK